MRVEISQKEIDRIEASAKDGKRYQDRMNAYRKNIVLGPVKKIKCAEWIVFEDVEVLQVPGSHYIGVPCSGRKSSAKFDILDLRNRTDIVCQLKKDEVYYWLRKAAED